MNTHSIEWLHAKIERRIRLAQSYTEIDSLAFVIKACRLKPYDYVFGEKSNKTVLERWWFDEFGNSLIITKKKAIKIIHGDLRLDIKRIISTDLYCGLSIDRVAKISRLVHITAGKDEDLYQNYYLLTFLGLDNHLRSYMHLYGEWQQVSPLMIGMRSLKRIFNNLHIEGFRQIGKRDNCPFPCASAKSYISCMPASNDFLELLRKECEPISYLVNE